MSWTNERVEKLKALWAEGMSASRIAQELGGVSRNAVIGKVHRLGLSNRTSGKEGGSVDPATKPEPPRAAEAEAAEPVETEQPVVAEDIDLENPDVVDTVVGEDDVLETDPALAENPIAKLAAEVERSARKLTLVELNERTCKWPIGDPSTDDFYFCGLPCAPDKPYCEAHVAVAYQPMSSRRDREVARRRTAG